MRRELITSALAVVVFTIALGLIYPLVVLGIGQAAFSGNSNGSQEKVGGKLVGSRLIGQDFSRPVLDKKGKPKMDAKGKPVTKADSKYFQSRPSADSYAPDATFFANRGPNSAAAKFFYRDGLATYLALEKPYVPGLTADAVPIDALTASASGVDPHISEANARIQAHRVAAVRHLPLSRVQALVKDNTDGRFIGLLGEPGVNVLKLNLAVQKEAASR